MIQCTLPFVLQRMLQIVIWVVFEIRVHLGSFYKGAVLYCVPKKEPKLENQYDGYVY